MTDPYRMAEQDHTPPDPRPPERARAGAEGLRDAGTEAAPRRPKRRRVRTAVRRLAGFVGGFGALVLVLLLAAQTPWGAARLGDAVLGLVNPINGATLDVGAFDGNWISRLELRDVTVTRDDTVRMARVDTVRLRYRLLGLLKKKIHLRDVYVARPEITLTQRADSTWDLLSLFEADTAAAPSAFTIQLDQLRLADGGLTARFYAPERDSMLRADSLNARLYDLATGETTTLRLDALEGRVTAPGSAEAVRVQAGARLADGRFTLDRLRLASSGSDVTGAGGLLLPSAGDDALRDIHFTFNAAPLAFRDLHPFVPTLDPEGRAEVDLSVDGSSRLLTALAEARFPDGGRVECNAAATPTVGDSVAYRLDAQVRRLDPAYFTGDPTMRGRLNADLDADLHGPALDRLGGDARAVVFDSRYGDYAPERTTLRLTFAAGQADLDLRTRLRGAGLTVGGILRPFDALPTYDLRGRFDSLDVGRFGDPATTLSDGAAGGGASSNLQGGFRVQGQGFDPLLADLTATLDLGASRINRYQLDAGAVTARLKGGVLDLGARLRAPEGYVEADGEVALGDAPRYRIRKGRLVNLDVAALLGDTTRSAFNGVFTLRGSGADPAADLRLDDLRLTLTDSFYGTYRINTAALNGTLRGGRLALNAEADLEGGAFDVAGVVRPFDAVPTFTLTRGAFSGVDVGRLTQDSTRSSNLTGTLTTLTGRGFDPATMTLDARLDLSASRYNEQAIDSARVVAGLRQGRLTVEAQLATPAGTTTLAGAGDPFEATPAFSFNQGSLNGLNLGALLGLPYLDTRLNGTVKTFDVRGSDPRTMTLKADLDLAESQLNRETIRDGAARIDLEDGLLRARLDLNLAEGAVRLDTLTARPFDERPTYAARGAIRNADVARLSGIDTLDAGFSARFAFDGEGFDPETMRLRVDTLAVTQARYYDVAVDTLTTRFRLADGLLEVDTLRLGSNVAYAAGSGPVALFDTLGVHASDFTLTGALLDTRPVRRFIDAEVFTVNRGTFTGRAFGDPGTLRFEAGASLRSLVYDDLRVGGVDARVEGALDRRRKLTMGELRAEMTYFSLPTLSVRYSEFKADLADGDIAFSTDLTVDFRREAHLWGRLDLGEAQQRVTLDSLRLDIDDDHWKLLQEASLSLGDEYRISNFLLYEDDQQIAVDGKIDPDGEQSLVLTVEQIHLAAIADLFNFPGLGGTLNGDLVMTGPAASPQVAGTLNLDVESLGDEVGDLRLDVNYDNLLLNLDARLTHVDDSTMTLRGYLPVDLRLDPSAPMPDANVSLRLQAGHFNVGWIEPFLDRETFDEIEGNLTADVTVGGTVETPELAGTLTFADGRLRLPEFNVTYTDAYAEAVLENDQVRLDHAVVRAGKGELIADGTIDLTQLTFGEFDITASAEDFQAINTRDYKAVVSADLVLRGTTLAPVLGGAVRLLSADFYLTEETTADEFGPVELTEQDLLMLERTFGVRVTPADTTTFDFYEALAIDSLLIEMERDVWLRSTKNPEMNIQFTGELALQKAPYADEQFFGDIEVIRERSYINQFGKRFSIQTGTLTFNGPAADPLLDIEAVYEVRSRRNQDTEITITLAVDGTLQDPNGLDLTLRSDPQTDLTNIVSYIATGRPANQAFQLGGSSVAGLGTDLALSQIAGLVEGAAGAELGLDVIEIRQEGLQGTTVTAGKYLSRRFYAAVSWPISFSGSSTTQETSTTSTSERQFTIEYELFNWLLVRLVSNGGVLQVNLLYEYAY